MSKKSIYVTGSPGFKSAIIGNLGSEWKHESYDIGQELICFELPETFTSGRFKNLIGESTLSDHNIMVFYPMRNRSLPTIQTLAVSARQLITRFWEN
jgi:hypothetical protein